MKKTICQNLLCAAVYLGIVLTVFFGGVQRAEAAQETAGVDIIGMTAEEPILEDPEESAKIETALLRQGYLRDDVPMSYELQAVLQAECEKNKVSYSLALALIETESGFQTNAVSACGSYGLCQINPEYFARNLSPAKNIAAGIGYLGDCIKRYNGNVKAGLTAYNAGRDTGNRKYASKVLAAEKRWK